VSELVEVNRYVPSMGGGRSHGVEKEKENGMFYRLDGVEF